MKALHGIPPPGVSTEDGFWANRELLLLFQKLCQPEVCAALAGARIAKRRAGVRGGDLRPPSGLAPS
jgi:hypothetical protein